MDSKLKNNEHYLGSTLNISVESVSSDSHLTTTPIYPGGFSNFGYWKNIYLPKEISFQDRIQSQVNLYMYLLNKLEIAHEDVLLEVGSGSGMGTLHAFDQYKPKSLIGLDISSSYVSRAITNKQKMHDKQAVSFAIGDGQGLSFADATFNAIYSIEAVQSMSSIDQFVNESHRVLIPKGRIGISTFFAQHDQYIPQLKEHIPTIESEAHKIISISKIIESMVVHKFKNITVESIGRHVFYSFDRWIDQFPEHSEQWRKNWFKVFGQGLIDYYVITGQK
jgi:MPBQ/MSBQ methyltransferase